MPRRRRRRPPIFIDTGSFPFQSAFFTQKEETVKKKIGILVLGAALAFGMSTGAWAQGGGAGGGAGGAGGGAAGTGAGGNSAGSFCWRARCT
jgi:hypothetical protein